ncbi:MAG: alpha/beta hydrolase [Halobacteriovoraceae bacterium]|nr:alpha/beta hydrolase [Halobacteriovoraceae bacterium]
MKTLLLLIPGNPSVPGIYEPFLNQIQEDLNLTGSVYSRVLPHLGQCNREFKDHGNIRVQDVVREHKRTIRKMLETHQPDRLILIGHSLGSAVTISMYQDFKEVADAFVILCPFLGPSRNNEKYLKMFSHPVTKAGMKGITYTALKSQKVSHQVFKKWLGPNPFNEHIPNEIRKPYYIKNFFSLVSNYFADFDELDVKGRIQEMCPKKSFFLFAPNDYWVPDESINHLPKEAKYKKLSNISHDFCLKETQYRDVSKAIANHLQEAFS